MSRVERLAAWVFSGGHGHADEDLYGYIDTTGKYVWEPQK